eukprot:gb/GFBE01036279.1/.p1 GENE.gb/GFBE01036279.1/~~gb/GFBE01036279.1/.p1  ORF type:complete len:528 (+),score=123.09 gb/GFBE01036279.1/:1-1584(+)
MARMRAAGAGSGGGGSLSGKSSLNWRLVTLVLCAGLILIVTCSQLFLLGGDCHGERERALHAEDLVLHFQSQREQERKVFEKQVADLQQQLQAKASTPSLRSSGDGGSEALQEMVRSLKAELSQVQRENADLKAGAGRSGSVAAPSESPMKVLQQRSAAASSGVVAKSRNLITEDALRGMAANGAIGTAIIVCKRPKYLSRTMDAVLRSMRDPSTFPIVISQDGFDESMKQLVQKTYVETGQAFHMHHQHDPNAQAVAAKFGGSKQALGYVRIAQHFGFVMKRMFDEFGFQAVIFLEEDLEVSPDFFSYFGSMRPLLRNDKDLFCVSAWNDNGYDSMVSDPKLAYRTDFFPGLGWMMDKTMWDEVRDRWAVAYWDEFMRRPDVRKGRHCIRPEISRTFTFGEEGVSSGQFFKGHLARIKLNNVMVDWGAQDIARLSSAQAFDDDLSAQIRAAQPTSLDEVDQYAGQSKALRIEYDDAKYKVTVAKKFGLMPDEKEGIRRMSYRGVIPFTWQTNRIYLHTRKWPADIH